MCISAMICSLNKPVTEEESLLTTPPIKITVFEELSASSRATSNPLVITRNFFRPDRARAR